MMILEGIIANKMTFDITRAIDYAVKVHATELEDLNTMELEKGVNMEGVSLGRYKSISYKGRLTPVDLKKTGAFHKSITVKSVKGVIELDSKDVKIGKLALTYGDDIVGLPKQAIQSGEVGEILLESIVVDIKRQIDNAAV